MAIDITKVDEWGDVPDYNIYLQYKGVWDMQELYEGIINFMRHFKYKVTEKLHFQTRPTAFGVEHKIQIEFNRRVEEYYKYYTYVYMHTFDLTDIEVKLPDGSIKTYVKGRIWIEIKGRCFVDADRRWPKTVFYQQLKSWYHKYVIQKKAEAIWWDKMHYKVTVKLRNVIQQKLKKDTEEFEARYFAGVH